MVRGRKVCKRDKSPAESIVKASQTILLLPQPQMRKYVVGESVRLLWKVRMGCMSYISLIVQQNWQESLFRFIFTLYVYTESWITLYPRVLSSDEKKTSNELPNLKNALQTRFRVSSMLDTTLIICNANYNADPNESEGMSEGSDNAVSESLHRHPRRCKDETQVIGKFRVMLSSKPKSMVEAYRNGVYCANYKDTAICFWFRDVHKRYEIKIEHSRSPYLFIYRLFWRTLVLKHDVRD